MTIVETDRLLLRRFVHGDAPFVLELLNDPAWIQYIGDRGVRTLTGAESYIERGPMAMYASHGFGLYLVEVKSNAEPVGICGLIKREFLDDVDIGFAFLPAHRAKGYAFESARAVLAYARESLGLERIVAITTLDNERSARLLEKLGFQFECTMQYPGEKESVCLYSCSLAGQTDQGVTS